MFDLECIRDFDAELYDCLAQELSRQRNNIELIASENLFPKGHGCRVVFDK